MALYGRQGPKPWAKRPGGRGAVRPREDLTTTYNLSARNEPSAQPKPTVAEAEAECHAAIAAIPSRDGTVEVAKDPRSMRAIEALRDAVTLDEDDNENFKAYLQRSVLSPLNFGGKGRNTGSSEQLVKTMKRWLRIRKYWPRLRRRICWGCGKEYDLSEPRLWVCGGCGEARYCDESCQRAHFPAHKKECLQTWHKKADERGLRGLESWAKLRQQFRDWYGDG